MVGILVQLAASWLIIWFFERKDLSVLGFRPTLKRIAGFILLFVVTATCCATEVLLKAGFGKQEWALNPALSWKLFGEATWWIVRSVLFEELIFRGALLYILIKKWGVSKAVIISAIAFGIYHWFSFGIIGNVPQMFFVFVITGAMGLLLGFAYAKTGSLYLPVAIHFGWNFTSSFVFSKGPIGDGLFIPVGPVEFRTDSMLLFLGFTILPLLSALLIDFFLIKSAGLFKNNVDW